MRKIPAIFTDIDGVLILGKKQIPRSRAAFQFLRQSLSIIDPKNFGNRTHTRFPFVGLTNGGGKLEEHKANEVNQVLNIQDDHIKWTKDNVVLNFSPLRPILKDYINKTILISGTGNIKLIASDCGLKRYITVDEYCALFPYLVPISKRDHKEIDKTKAIIEERFGEYNEEMFKNPFKIDAVFILNDVLKWEENVQVLCDILGTNNGTIPQHYPKKPHKPHIPVWCVNDDFLYADEFRLPRHAFGAFTVAFRAIYNRLYKDEPDINFCGKPEKITFEYAKTKAEKLCDMPIGNCYMLGDNPEGDIKGANNMKWTSILVRTGIHKDKDNCRYNPATYIVDDFYEGVKLIMELEGIKNNL